LYFTGLVRDFPDAQKEFTDNDGVSRGNVNDSIL
jgi:hypothetical protein